MRSVLAVLGAALLVSACGVDDGSVPASVVVVGDSITVASERAIRRDLAARGVDSVTIDAEIGRRIAVGDGSTGGPINGVIITDGLLADGLTADTWVVALGTNDVGQYGSVEEREAIAELLALIPGDANLVWVNTCLPGRDDQSRRFNDNLAAVVGERDDTLVAQWSDTCADPGLLLPDQIHPDIEGQAAFAGVIGEAVAG